MWKQDGGMQSLERRVKVLVYKGGEWSAKGGGGGHGLHCSRTRTKSHLGQSGGMLPMENLEFTTLRVFLRLSESSSLYVLCKAYTEKYTHLKNKGAHPSPPSFKVGGTRTPSAPLFLHLYGIVIKKSGHQYAYRIVGNWQKNEDITKKTFVEQSNQSAWVWPET